MDEPSTDAYRQVDNAARFEAELPCPTASWGESQTVVMRGLGLFRLKGLPAPVPLVEAWLPETQARTDEFPEPKGAVFAQKGRLLERSGSGDSLWELDISAR